MGRVYKPKWVNIIGQKSLQTHAKCVFNNKDIGSNFIFITLIYPNIALEVQF